VAGLDPDQPAPVLYAEPGSTWWPLSWGPAFAAVGLGFEEFTRGRPHPGNWLVVGLGLFGAAAVWVNARRRVCSVQLTPLALHQGREVLPVRSLVAVDEVGTPVGVRVLGGGWFPPRGATGVPLRLDDGSVVLAWARHPERLRDALRALLDQPGDSSSL
jgi:hypothetical protein